jgi:hypothetical protein
LQLVGFFGQLLGQVVFLPCILSQVVKFDRAVIEELNKLEVALPYRPG